MKLYELMQADEVTAWPPASLRQDSLENIRSGTSFHGRLIFTPTYKQDSCPDGREATLLSISSCQEAQEIVSEEGSSERSTFASWQTVWASCCQEGIVLRGREKSLQIIPPPPMNSFLWLIKERYPETCIIPYYLLMRHLSASAKKSQRQHTHHKGKPPPRSTFPLCKETSKHQKSLISCLTWMKLFSAVEMECIQLSKGEFNSSLYRS